MREGQSTKSAETGIVSGSGKSQSNVGHGASGKKTSGEGIVSASGKSSGNAYGKGIVTGSGSGLSWKQWRGNGWWSWQFRPGERPQQIASLRKDPVMKITANSAMDRQARTALCCFVLATVALCAIGPAMALGKDRPANFLPEERKIILEYFHQGGPSKGLPPGLAKRGGKLPPGLQKHLDKNGRLPPGLQKRLQPVPADLDRRLPRLPEYWKRVILERDVILVDRRTNRILDIIENVIGLATGR
jgi:hypothetical protein